MPASGDVVPLYVPPPEVAEILAESCRRRYGVVELEGKMSRGWCRSEVLKIHMRRHYPSASMRSDLIDSMDTRLFFNIPVYFKHKSVNKKKNMEKARSYLQQFENKGFFGYINRHRSYDDYKCVIERKNEALKDHYKELQWMHHKSGHVHFLHQMLFVKQLWNYPLPKVWICLLAIQKNSPYFERILAAIRVLTDYDGKRAPEFFADLY